VREAGQLARLLVLTCFALLSLFRRSLVLLLNKNLSERNHYTALHFRHMFIVHGPHGDKVILGGSGSLCVNTIYQNFLMWLGSKAILGPMGDTREWEFNELSYKQWNFKKIYISKAFHTFLE